MRCRECGGAFKVSDEEAAFLKRLVFTFGVEQVNIPPPVQCSDCRLQIRTAHRNEQYMYHRVSDLSGKRVVSLYAPAAPRGKPYKVYEQEEWHGDHWDPLAYGRDYDFQRPFFEQFYELQKAVPRLALVSLNNENSPYTTGTGYCKNCHLINCSEYSENCYYGKLVQSCRDCVDCSYIYKSELCCQCFSVYECYSCTYLAYSQNCNDCFFSENLIGCRNCLYCSNLQRQEFCVLNKKVSRKEYHDAVAAVLGSHRGFETARRIWQELRAARIHKYANIVNCERCTGDFLVNSKNCRDCYDTTDSEDCRYVCVGVSVKDVYDSSNVYLEHELDYQIIGTIGAYNCAFSIYIFHCRDLLYCDHVYDSRSCFGCSGLKRKEYCILNRQYSAEEYNKLVPRIVRQMQEAGEWGRFFPPEHSPYGYNESLAFDYFPVSKDEVQRKGWNWRDEEAKSSTGGTSKSLPDLISDTGDEICKSVLICEATGQEYKIIQPELKFYRRQNIPIPRRAPLQRHRDREALRNKRTVYSRDCRKCGRRISTNFAPDRPEVVYCEACYQEAVF